MQIQAKKVLFHISQLLLIIAIISTGMPAKADEKLLDCLQIPVYLSVE